MDIHAAFLELDRKNQAMRGMHRNGIEPDPGQYKLTEAQKRALLFIDEHVSSDPL